MATTSYSARNHVVYGWQAQSVQPPARFVRSERIYLWDAQGRRYADFAAGQINVNVGYNHPTVLAAMRRQMESLSYIAPNFESEPRSQLAAMVAGRVPAGLDYVFFTNSGSESIEAAVKIARAVTGRSKIYSAWRSYHGNTALASAISGDPRRLFVESSPSANKFHGATCYCCPFGTQPPPQCQFACLSSLERSITLEAPETIAAIVLEPIVGSSGLYVPPPQFIRGVRQLCDAHGILLIMDETMTGWGRTGRWFGCEHYEVRPDLLTTAKGITSGYVPLGAVVMTPRLRDFFLDRAFVGGLTNEGHALACAAGIANIEVYESEQLIERSRVLGEHLLHRLEDLKARHPCVGDVRGKGLFACIELTANAANRTALAGYRDRNGGVSGQLTRLLFDAGVLVIAKWDYLFIAPPLVIEQDELDAGLDRIDAALTHIDALAAQRSAR